MNESERTTREALAAWDGPLPAGVLPVLAWGWSPEVLSTLRYEAFQRGELSAADYYSDGHGPSDELRSAWRELVAR